jgi:hypothetical protein
MCEIRELMNYGLTDWECDCLETKANFESVEQIMEFYEEGKGKDEERILSIKHFGRKRYDKVICAAIDCLDDKKGDKDYIPALNLTIEKDFPEKEDGTVDVEKVSNNILTKDELADIIINLAMDLIEESNSVEILNKNYESDKCKDSRLFVSQKRIYVEKSYLEKEFNKKVKNLYIDSGEPRNKYFEIALTSSMAVEKKYSSKLGIDFLYTRKAFSPNKENYVEIDIINAENQVNRIFNNPFVPAEMINYNYIPIEEPREEKMVTKTNKNGIIIVSSQIPPVKLPEPVVKDEDKTDKVEVPNSLRTIEEPKSNIILIPKSIKGNNQTTGLVFSFSMYCVDDIEYFDLDNEKAYRGEYIFYSGHKEDGELMISGLFDQHQTIKRKVLSFLNG